MKKFVFALGFIFCTAVGSFSAQAEDLRTLMPRAPRPAPEPVVVKPTAVSIGRNWVKSEVLERILQERTQGVVSNTSVAVEVDDYLASDTKNLFLMMTVRFDRLDGGFITKEVCSLIYEGRETDRYKFFFACKSPATGSFYIDRKEILED